VLGLAVMNLDLRHINWKNHTHPVTYREMIPVLLDLKLVASQVGRKTTFMVEMHVKVWASCLVPMRYSL